MSMDASSTESPRPDGVTTPAEFVAAMRALRERARLTYRQIEQRARELGETLPHSTIATALSRNRIPRESTIASFVRACGEDDETVELWLAARRRITATADKSVKSVGHLAKEVEAWYTTHFHSTVEVPDHTGELSVVRTFADGRLAEAVLHSKGERWVGVHRRRRPERSNKLGGLVRKLRRATTISGELNRYPAH